MRGEINAAGRYNIHTATIAKLYVSKEDIVYYKTTGLVKDKHIRSPERIDQNRMLQSANQPLAFG